MKVLRVVKKADIPSFDKEREKEFQKLLKARQKIVSEISSFGWELRKFFKDDPKSLSKGEARLSKILEEIYGMFK